MSDFFLLMKQELAITVIIFFLLFVKITGKRANAGDCPGYNYCCCSTSSAVSFLFSPEPCLLICIIQTDCWHFKKAF